MDKEKRIAKCNQDLSGELSAIIQLEELVRDESGHSEETERILRDWPLS